jgi:hypothetical protein
VPFSALQTLPKLAQEFMRKVVSRLFIAPRHFASRSQMGVIVQYPIHDDFYLSGNLTVSTIV